MHEKVKQAQAGDLMAFGELVKMFQDAVYGVAYSMLGNFHDAQDIAQEAFIQAWRDLDSLKEPAKFPNWLCRIAKNRCMDFLRQAKLDMVELEEAYTINDPSPGPLEQVEKKELTESVLAAVRALPEKLRLTTTLFYINGYTINEVAEFLEVPAGTIKRRLHDSRKRLKESMMKDKKMIEIMVGGTLKSFPLPGDFAEVVVRIVASDEDLKQLNKFMGPTESVADAQRGGLFVVEEEGKVESAGQIKEGTWTIGSTIVKSAGSPAGVAGEAAVPGVEDEFIDFVKGYRGFFKLAKEKGIRLAIVHGSQYDHAFCGFVPCFYYAVATLPIEKAKSIVTCATLREVRDEKEEEIARDTIARDPYRTKMSASPVRVVEHNGVAGGYITLDRNGYPGNLTLKTREAALAVIKLMGECVERTGGKEILVMESHKTMITQTILTLGGKYLLRPSCDLVGLDAEMVAIIDLIGLTQDLQGEFQGRINASRACQADGAFSIEMSCLRHNNLLPVYWAIFDNFRCQFSERTTN